MDNIEKQRQVYYVLAALEGNERFDKTSFSLILDNFISNNNAYATLLDISIKLKENGINISPENLYHSVSIIDMPFSCFDSFPETEDINAPFRLRKKVFDGFANTNDAILELNKIVDSFIDNHGYDKSLAPLIIDVLLETIFTRNIQFLRSIVSRKQDASVSDLAIKEKRKDQDEIVIKAYNSLLLEPNDKFDDTIRILILRMFDFLSLYYNPEYEKSLNQKFSGKNYYLDSSFIVRLLGFDGNFRTERSLELVRILSGVKDIHFIVHEKTIEESQKTIKELIDKNSKILNQNTSTIKAISKRTGKSQPIFELYSSLKESGKITSYNDFRLYYSNIKKLLKRCIPSITYDSKSLYSDHTERESLYQELQKTDKTPRRIKHIVKLLDYIDKLRGANNYNPLEVKYWLLTTDKKTLEIDNNYIEENADAGKSICIMPSEVIRQIDYCSGNIQGNHIRVFKQYMLHTKAYANQYTEEEVDTITKIATMVESTDLEKYDLDTMLDNLFTKYSLEEIQNRITILKSQKEKDIEIIELFNETNEDYIDTKYSRAINRIYENNYQIGKSIFIFIIWIIPIGLTLYLLYSILDFETMTSSPDTWIDTDKWGKLEGVFAVVDFLLYGFANFIDKSYKDSFCKWFAKKRVESFKSKLE